MGLHFVGLVVVWRAGKSLHLNSVSMGGLGTVSDGAVIISRGVRTQSASRVSPCNLLKLRPGSSSSWRPVTVLCVWDCCDGRPRPSWIIAAAQRGGERTTLTAEPISPNVSRSVPVQPQTVLSCGETFFKYVCFLLVASA